MKTSISVNALKQLNSRFNVITLGRVCRVCREAVRQRFKRANMDPLHHRQTKRWYDDYLRIHARDDVDEIANSLQMNPLTIRHRMVLLELKPLDKRQRPRSKLPSRNKLLSERQRLSVPQLAKKYKVKPITIYKHLKTTIKRPHVTDESIAQLKELPPHTIATQLNISLNTVKRRLIKILTKLEQP